MSLADKLREIDAEIVTDCGMDAFVESMREFAGYLNARFQEETFYVYVSLDAELQLRRSRLAQNEDNQAVLNFKRHPETNGIWASPPSRTLRGPVCDTATFEEILCAWYADPNFIRKITT